MGNSITSCAVRKTERISRMRTQQKIPEQKKSERKKYSKQYKTSQIFLLSNNVENVSKIPSDWMKIMLRVIQFRQ